MPHRSAPFVLLEDPSRTSSLILLAIVSQRDRERLESGLADLPVRLVSVATVAEAERALEPCREACVLVIDAGLLEAGEDSPWRPFLHERADLVCVTRALIPEAKGPVPGVHGSWWIHPSDLDGLRRLLQMLVHLGTRQRDVAP